MLSACSVYKSAKHFNLRWLHYRYPCHHVPQVQVWLIVTFCLQW
jgi:hypothetical protein